MIHMIAVVLDHNQAVQGAYIVMGPQVTVDHVRPLYDRHAGNVSRIMVMDGSRKVDLFLPSDFM